MRLNSTFPTSTGLNVGIRLKTKPTAPEIAAMVKGILNPAVR
jgi:hypothetical protein